VRRPKRRGASTAARDRWILSYADFITLMFAFFTTLYAASNVDAAHWSTVASGLSQALNRTPPPASATETPSMSGHGVLPGGRGLLDNGGLACRAGLQACPGNPEQVQRELERELGDVLKTNDLRLTSDHRGLVLSIPEAGAFPIGSSDISSAANNLIGRIANALQRLPNAVRIEGHTDGTPIHTARFASNWELSTARATSVVEFLVERGGIAPARLSAAGYAEFHPVADNQDAATRFRNRRVDIIILNNATQAAEEPAAEPQR
jgi:chemotaxis protein MotB